MVESSILHSLERCSFDELLACHAFIVNALNVPRVYIPRFCLESMSEHIVQTCLFSDISETFHQTQLLAESYVHVLGSDEMLLIEEILRARLGAGSIHYEFERLTPFAGNNAVMAYARDSELLSTLKKRAKDQSMFRTTYGAMCSNPSCSLWGLPEVAKGKVNALWTGMWGHQHNYLPHNIVRDIDVSGADL